MKWLLPIKLLWIVVLFFSISASGKDVVKKRSKSEGVIDLLASYQRLQFVAPPASDEKIRTHDIGSVEFSPEKGDWPISLAANLVEEQAADGTRSWPFSVHEDSVTHDILIRNRDGRVIYALESEPSYDQEWVFRNKFRLGQNLEKAKAFERFKQAYAPSRVVMTGRFVLAVAPEGQETDLEGTPDPVTRASPLAFEDSNVQSSFAPIEMQESFVLSGISTNTPGIPPGGYSDGLYVQHGTGTPYLFKTGGNLRSITQASSCSLLVFADNSVLGVGYDPRTYNPCAPSVVPPVNAVFNVPTDMTNILCVTADCHNYFLFLKNDGRVRGWGQEDNAFGRGEVPANVTNATSVVAGWMHAAALLEGGRVAEWGFLGASAPGVPASVTNVTALAAGLTTTLALCADKTVVEWDYFDGELPVPSNVTNVMSIAKTDSHSLALRGDGTVVAWGNNYSGQIDVPDCVTNAIAVAAGGAHSMALLKTGGLVVWGGDYYGATDIPESASGAVGIYAANDQCHALLPDGSAVVWGGWDFADRPPQQPLDTLGANGSCRVLQTAYSESAGDGLLLGLVRASENLFTSGWPTTNVVTFGVGLWDDADEDDLPLFDELFHYGTDPDNPDTDNDGLDDGKESLKSLLLLWDPSSLMGQLYDCYATQITASDTARAALLDDGSVILFSGASTNMCVYTNMCSAVQIDATDKWILARLAGGGIKVWRENTSGGFVETSFSYTNAVEISGGKSHFLVRHGNGKVTCIKEGTGSTPTEYASGPMTTVNTACKVSAGIGSDAALLSNNSLYFCDATSRFSGITKTFTDPSWTNALVHKVEAGSNGCYSVLFSTGMITAFKKATSSTNYLAQGGWASIAMGGDSHLLAVMSDGSNGTFFPSAADWSYTYETNQLWNSRSIWWRRGCRMAVTDLGVLLPLQNSVGCLRALGYVDVAVTPGGLARGIAMATSGTSATDNDSDDDGMLDGWEIVHGFNPGDPLDASMDSDGDGLTNYGEYMNNTDPYNRDTDGDTYWDGWEFANNFNPTDPSDTGADPDGDGLTNAREKILGTNKDIKDTDGDGLSDGAESEVPFPVLWDASGDTAISLTNLFVAQVTASGTARAARLTDGRVIIFTGSITNMMAYTNNCVSVEEIDATDAWIAARLTDGNVKIWREVSGGLAEFSLGTTNAVEISGGLRHLLVRYKDGKVACLKPNTSTGVPEVYTSSFCSGVTTAKRISAGSVADAILLADNSFRFGDALTTAYTTKTFTGTPTPIPLDVAAGTNKNYVVLFSNGWATAYKQTASVYNTSTGVVAIAAGGDAQLLAVFSNGSNAVFTTGGTTWNYTQVTNNLLTARDLWWRRNCRLAVYESGNLVPMQNATDSVSRLDFFSAAVTPGGLARGIAAACIGSCPTNSDTDADELLDGWEAANGFDPRNPGDVHLDTDSDSMPDWWEIMNGFNRFAGSDATADADGDDVTNAIECARGTDPRNPASVNRTLYVDSAIGNDSNDGYWSYVRSYGRGPKASVQQTLNAALSGDVIELRGVPAFTDHSLTTGSNEITLVPVGSVRF